jgi:hypothetical protein
MKNYSHTKAPRESSEIAVKFGKNGSLARYNHPFFRVLKIFHLHFSCLCGEIELFAFRISELRRGEHRRAEASEVPPGAG